MTSRIFKNKLVIDVDNKPSILWDLRNYLPEKYCYLHVHVYIRSQLCK